ncbi:MULTISPECIES: hypothetical protein [Salipiger]|uniref:Uncharacterized protein n=1 Tax=Salipiger profundus TaxID=1229727 RepID=A0A1U7DB76_9RHOB|nr:MULTISPECIES: hypothetical protein [Salipiger]APX25310.1 hypothetical protein Ga0080559_TMP4514 [Salipiger profundus]GGA30381.1 hypothetical protein GCM10011326_47860 [Salipiger profundus]SFD95762.1 hypothetical protein SAMN05444415_1331 [Salipiger profundus]
MSRNILVVLALVVVIAIVAFSMFGNNGTETITPDATTEEAPPTEPAD